MRSLLLVALIGCRAYPTVTVSQPTLPPDQVIEIKSTTADVRTGTRDVCDGESRCRTEDTTREEKRSQILVSGQPLTYGQLRLIDPAGGADYAKHIAEYGERAKPCRVSRKYKIAGVVTTVVGGIVALIDKAPTAVRIGGLAVAAAGVGVIYLGYQKGSGCDEVHRLYLDNQLDLAGTKTVRDRKDEIDDLAARFNSARGHGPPPVVRKAPVADAPD